MPVPHGAKNPVIKKWQLLQITEAEVPRYFPGRCNVGALMGPASRGLTDVDLDCKEAVALAGFFLPATGLKYGRPGKRTSHYLYTCNDPDPKAWIKWLDEKKACIVELRLGGGGKGSQSVMPGSVHVSGEHYEWEMDDERATVSCATLKAAIVKIAIGTLLVRHWPALGSRHDTALALGGFLARAGWTADEVEYFVTTICKVHGEATSPEAHGKTARDSVEHHEAGGHVYGMPTMIEIFGELVAKQIAKHLNYKSTRDAPKVAPDGRPVALFGELSMMADRAEETLLAAKVPFYQRGKILVRPVITSVETFQGGTTSTAQLVAVELPYLRDAMCRVAQWLKLDKRSGAWVPIHPPTEAAMVLLNRFGHWRFPAIAGVINTPTLRLDGTILSAPGFDPATRLLLVDPPEMPPISEQPSKGEALAALELLKGLLTEFPFVDDVARSVALSAYLSVVCRGAFPVMPMHLVTAPVAGSGKSYLLSTVSYIATGQAMPVIGAGGSEEEMEKRLGAAVIAGWPLICLDNMIGKLGGQALCQLVEQPRPHVRILGHSQLVPVEARGVAFFANGNNVTVYGDAFRRILTSQLDPRLERPELRSFKGNPVQMIMANRGAYIAAALTVCRAYQEAGQPNRQAQIGSFNEWSDTVRSALVWLGEADPLKSMETARAEDPEANELQIMLDAWVREFGSGADNCASLQELANRCNETHYSPNTGIEFSHRALREAVQLVIPGHPYQRQQITPALLGLWMRKNKNRRLGGMWFVNKAGTHGGPTTWWVELADAPRRSEADPAPPLVSGVHGVHGAHPPSP